MIDWTPLDALVNATGTPEYRVESDGLVRLRGLVTLITGAVGYTYLPVPARPLNSVFPLLIDWGTGQRSVYVSDNTGLMYLGYFGDLGPGAILDLKDIAWFGTPPPPNPHSLEGVQTGIANALKTIAGLHVYDFPSDRVEPPAAVLSLPETPYDVTLGGHNDAWTFPLWVLIAKADDKASYAEMVDYLEEEGPKSIRAVVEADTTLGGACDTVSVLSARPLFATVAGTEFLAVEFTVEVYT